MIRLLLALSALALLPDAAAASCTTYTQARAEHPSAHLVYRLEGRRSGNKCWYAPVEKRTKLRGPTSTAEKNRPATAKATTRASPESGDAGRVQDRMSASTRPTIHARIVDAFDIVDYFTTLPWHDDLWLAMQVHWLRASGSFGTPVWIMTSRWP